MQTEHRKDGCFCIVASVGVYVIVVVSLLLIIRKTSPLQSI